MPIAVAGLARTLLASGHAPAALQSLEKALQQHPQDFELIRAYADGLWDDGDVQGALTQSARLRGLQPENAALLAREGQILASAGRVSEALERHLEALALNPRCIAALHGLATRKRRELDAGHRDVIVKLLRNGKLAEGSRATLHNALAYCTMAKANGDRPPGTSSKATHFSGAIKASAIGIMTGTATGPTATV